MLYYRDRRKTGFDSHFGIVRVSFRVAMDYYLMHNLAFSYGVTTQPILIEHMFQAGFQKR